MGSRWIRTGAAVAATLLCVAATALSAWVDARVADPPASTVGGVYAVVFAATGTVLVHLRPRNAIGWLLVLTGLLQALSVGGGAYGGYGVDVAEPEWPLARWAAQFGPMAWLPSLVLPATVLVALYPSGRLPARWWRWPVAAVSVGLVVLTISSSLDQSTYDDTASGSAPLDLPTAWWVPAAVSAGAAVVGGAFVIWGATVVRLVRARPPERQQLAWLVCVVLPLMAAVFVLPDPVEWLALPLALMVPGAVVVGVVRYRLLGIVVSRALVYATLTAAVVVLYLTIAAVAAAALGRTLSPVSGAVAAALLAVALSPARSRLQAAADRFVYGRRGDPVTAVTELGDRVADADEADLLPAVPDALTAALRTPAARVAPPGEPPGSGGVAVPLRVGGRDVGTLCVAERSPGEPFTAGDRRLLAALAPQVAAVVRALELTRSLERERDRVLTATHAERDRIRRDLHDGLGPSLAGISLGVQAVQVHLGQRADPLLTRLRDEVDAAVGEVRRILDGLRPAALDDVGFVAAVRRHADALAPSVPVRVIAEELPPLPPEVETAAYRIAQEALTNVARHAGARSAEVGLCARDGRLEVAVADDGAGFEPRADGAAGVGLDSMRTRARAVGGELTVTSRPGGTRVVAGLALVGRCAPDVVLTDLSMPRLSGTAAIDELTRRRPGLGVLVLTMHEDDGSLLGALRAGARGYLLKGADREEIVRAVLAVAGGDAVYGGAVARRVVDALTGPGSRAPVLPELTGREREVLELLAAGLPTGQIARRLALSDKTVRNHVSAVLTKLQVPDRAAAVARAREAGLGQP